MLKNKSDSEIVKELFDNLSSVYTVARVYLQKKFEFIIRIGIYYP